MADCGPGRLTVWKELSVETVAVVLEELEVFLEQGQVEEVMMDMVFQSEFLQIRLERWNIRRYFRAVYRPGGNGIVDWKHQTKKAIAAKREISPVEAIF